MGEELNAIGHANQTPRQCGAVETNIARRVKACFSLDPNEENGAP